MKKLYLLISFAIVCITSFGQNVTDFTFTGMLAKTTYSQFSISANNTLAAPSTGWISAIAAPTVNVANITDMALTIGSGSAIITSPSPAGPVPTNYTGSILPVTGLVYTNYSLVYLKSNTVEKYRAVNIFIHKLVPADLPLTVTNSQQTTGFAHCGEVSNTGGGTPQLHTVGQYIYLAFNSEAGVVKFQYENGGTSVSVIPGALLTVEKSSDLVTWTTLSNIDISQQLTAIKVDHTVPVNDTNARYIRIGVAGISSRGERRESIRNISVLPVGQAIVWNQDLTGLKTTDTQIELTATSIVTPASSPAGSPITYASSNTNVVTVSGSTLNVVGAGTATITASQAAINGYAAAVNVVKTVNVLQPQTITFTAIPDKVYGTLAFSLSATSSSGGAVTFMSSKPSVATVSGSNVTIVGAGTDCYIYANQAGNATYAPAPQITDIKFSVTPKPLTMSGLSVPASKVYNGSTLAVVSGTKTLQASVAIASGTTTDGKPYTGETVSITGTAVGTYNSKDVSTATSVTYSGLSLTGAKAANYLLTIQSPSAATITAKPLSIGTPSIASKVYDGIATSGTVTPGSLSGFVSGEAVTVNTAVGTYPDANVGTGKTATIAYTLANGANGGLATNYSLSNGSATGDITAASGSPTGDNLNNSGLTDNQLANTNLTVSSGEFIINDTKTVRSLTVAPGAKLTHSSGTLTATNGITLESDATGTATLMDSYTEPTISATVKQYVTAGRNWYMSAPLNNTADYSALNKGASVAEYNEVTGLWPTISSGTLTRGKGYVQVASASQGTTGTVSFAGTTNSGNVAVALSNTLAGGKGYNLVGNPYPSYLSWSAVAADNAAANMPTGTMWYRTISYNEKNAWAASTAYSLNTIVYNGTRFYKVTTAGTSAATGGPTGGLTGIVDGSVVWNYEGSIYLFATISASGVASPATVSNLVPPMQAFWVKSTGGTLTFKNTMRSHNTGGTNALKAPKSAASDLKLLRLNVSNGASADEAVIYASADANNAFDTYDAPKYFNLAGSNQPEIYTQVGDEKLVINAMSEINQGTEIPLGFATEKGNNFTISASEFRNFGSDTKVILKDKQTSAEFDLTAGQSYPFSSSVVKSTDRFSLIFRTSGVSTYIENTNRLNAQVFVNEANQITIIAPVKSNYAIYNALGQLIENGVINTERETRNTKQKAAGVYMVKVNNQSTRVIIK